MIYDKNAFIDSSINRSVKIWGEGATMERIAKKVVTSFFLFIFLVLSCLVFADAINYFYDDAGRLVRVAKGTEGLVYQYDAVARIRID